MCGDIAHATTPQPKLQMHLSRILTPMGQIHLDQCDSRIFNGAKGDKGKCTAAKFLLEEALSILCTLAE